MQKHMFSEMIRAEKYSWRVQTRRCHCTWEQKDGDFEDSSIWGLVLYSIGTEFEMKPVPSN